MVSLPEAEAANLSIGDGIESLVREPAAGGDTVTVVCRREPATDHHWPSSFTAAWLTLGKNSRPTTVPSDMRQITVQRSMPAPRSAVWAVLADFPNIAQWNSGVAKSYATSDAIGGVGAQRHCDLSPAGTLEETIRAWDPENKMVVSIDSATKLPIRRGEVTFTLTEQGDGSATEIDYRYDTKWGVVGRLMGPLLDSQLTKGFNGFLVDLEAAAGGR